MLIWNISLGHLLGKNGDRLTALGSVYFDFVSPLLLR